MKARVLRAPLPRSIPTLGQIAAALAVTSLAPSAEARGPKDAGVSVDAIDAGKTDAGACDAEDAMDLLASGKLAHADAALSACIDACPPKIRVACVNARGTLASRIPHIIVDAPAEDVMSDAGPMAAHAHDGGAETCPMVTAPRSPLAHVMLDGAEVPLKQSIAVDPGEHLVTFMLADGSSVDEKVLANEGALMTVMLPPSMRGPEIPLGGEPPPPPHSFGCCGGSHEDYATNQLRAIAALALGIVVAGARRKTRKK